MSEFYKQVKDANSGTLSGNRIDNISSLLVSRRGLYAVRVNNADKVLEFNDYISSDATNSKNQTYKEWINEGFIKKVIKKTIQQCGNCSDAQEEALFELNFVNFFNQLDTGLGLFVSYETDDNGDYIWTSLTN